MKNTLVIFILFITLSGCTSTKSTLQNTDDNAPDLQLTQKNTFIITEYSTDKKYGYNKDYPINIFFSNTNNETINQERFINALAGPKGEKITFTKLESCCPFPTKRSEMGAGLLDVFELKWDGQKTPVLLYLNIYEKGVVKVPVGLTLKK
nr:2-dehydro-3-deoxyphosphooctonate aldolase [uncultured Flavobacterium sp.]